MEHLTLPFYTLGESPAKGRSVPVLAGPHTIEVEEGHPVPILEGAIKIRLQAGHCGYATSFPPGHFILKSKSHIGGFNVQRNQRRIAGKVLLDRVRQVKLCNCSFKGLR